MHHCEPVRGTEEDPVPGLEAGMGGWLPGGGG